MRKALTIAIRRTRGPDSMLWSRDRHNITFGGDFRGSNSITCPNRTRAACSRLRARPPQGSANGAAVGGDDFADFLLGIPDTSSIAFGNADKYFRESVYDAYITDDWRMSPQFTLNAGMRWEYGAPITELYGRLVNLDIASGFCGGSAGGGQRSRGAADRPKISRLAHPAGQARHSNRAWGLPGGRSPGRRCWFAPDMESTTTLPSIKPSRSKWRSKRRSRRA